MFRVLKPRVAQAGILALFCCTSGAAIAQEHGAIERSSEEVEVSDDWVLVPGHRAPDGVWIEGVDREPARPQEVWVDPHVDAHGVNVPGHWIPEAPEDQEAYRYEGGHRDDTGAWVPGFWRLEHHKGFEWVAGYYDEDERWISGHWRPRVEREGSVWVPGHVIRSGRRWRIGFWRPMILDGYIWIDGYYADGAWYNGYWSPIATRTGFIWVPGYASDLMWHLGYWRLAHRPGFTWAPGYWDGHLWIAGHWVAGAWRCPVHGIIGHYAHYHHSHGHGHDHGHAHHRRARYVIYGRKDARSGGQKKTGLPTVIVKEKAKGESSQDTHIWSETAQPYTPSRERERETRRPQRAKPLPATNPRYDTPPRVPRRAAEQRRGRSGEAAKQGRERAKRAPAARRTDMRRPAASPKRTPRTLEPRAKRSKARTSPKIQVPKPRPKRPSRVKVKVKRSNKEGSRARIPPTAPRRAAAQPVPKKQAPKKKVKVRSKKQTERRR